MLVEQAVTSSFYAHEFVAHHTPFLESLEGSAAFEGVLAIAARRVAETGKHLAARRGLAGGAGGR